MGYDADYLAYMMKYDSIHGKYDGTVEVDGDSLVIDGQKVELSHTRDPSEIPFSKYGDLYVCESTGAFLTEEKIQPHLKAGAKKIIFSAPAKDDSKVIDGREPGGVCRPGCCVVRVVHDKRPCP